MRSGRGRAFARAASRPWPGTPFPRLPASLLDEEVAHSGGSTNAATQLSAGQKQLLSFARVLLQNTPIVVCDEPTSNIDVHSDAELQRVIRSKLGNRTVIQIAHRLNTIIDCDRVLVLDAGRVAEFASPSDLLANPESQFLQYARALGPKGFGQLQAKADEAAARRKTAEKDNNGGSVAATDVLV